MTENSTALLFDILDTATQGDPDSAANNIALLNQLLSATDNDPSNISANEIALLTEILSIISDQPPDVAANEIALLTEILAVIQTQNPQVRENKIALLNEIVANSQSLVDALNPVVLPVAASDLIAWYPFREGTGEDVTAGDSNFGDTTDYSASVNGATFQASGGVTDIQTGANSGAFGFDGVDDGIIHDISGEIVFGDSVTAMMWVKNRAPVSETRIIFSLPRFSGSDDRAVGLFTQSGGFNGHVDDSSTGLFPVESVTDTFASSFHHYAVRYDGSTASLHIDGQLVDSVSASLSTLKSSDTIRIGKPGVPDANPSDIIADGVRLYNGSLSDSQINQIYLNTKP